MAPAAAADDLEACNEASRLVATSGQKEDSEVLLERLRRTLQEHHRRLRDLEAQLGRSARAVRGQERPRARSWASEAAPDAQRGESSASFKAAQFLGAEQGASEAAESSQRPNRSTSDAADGAEHSGQLRQPSISNDKQARTGVSEDLDHYNHLVKSAANLDHKQIFDQDLNSIYNKPFKRARDGVALMGSVVGGVLSLPFGPIGMAAGAVIGAILGAVFGLIVDYRRTRTKLQQSELEKKRLKSLVRWAVERLSEDNEMKLIEMVVLEFKPIADIASGSKNARKLLKVLDGWIAQKQVQRYLWVYMDQLLMQWRDLTREQFLRSVLVFQALTTMYMYANRALSKQEAEFLARMERLLKHPSVQAVMTHAQTFPTQGNCRVMESMIYADAARLRRRTKGSSSGADSPARTPSGGDAEEMARQAEASDSEGDNSDQETFSQSGGLAASPSEAPAAEPGPPKLVLKKPFFKNWEDFMDFDLTFKHKMPITLSEFDLLLQKEVESTQGWDVCIDRKEMRVAKVQSGVGVITVRAWATLPGLDMHAAFHVFFDTEERTRWDKVMAKMAIIDNDTQGSDVLYSLLRIPGVTPRDFLQYRRVRTQEDGSIVIVLRSADHPDMPEIKGNIRAESFISGYVLRQTYEGTTPVLSLFLMSCTDVKGMIPKWIINFMAPKKPCEWIDSLRKAAMEYQEACPDFKQRELQLMARFSAENPFDYEPVNEGPAASERSALEVSRKASGSTCSL